MTSQLTPQQFRLALARAGALRPPPPRVPSRQPPPPRRPQGTHPVEQEPVPQAGRSLGRLLHPPHPAHPATPARPQGTHPVEAEPYAPPMGPKGGVPMGPKAGGVVPPHPVAPPVAGPRGPGQRDPGRPLGEPSRDRGRSLAQLDEAKHGLALGLLLSALQAPPPKLPKQRAVGPGNGHRPHPKHPQHPQHPQHGRGRRVQGTLGFGRDVQGTIS